MPQMDFANDVFLLVTLFPNIGLMVSSSLWKKQTLAVAFCSDKWLTQICLLVLFGLPESDFYRGVNTFSDKKKKNAWGQVVTEKRI